MYKIHLTRQACKELDSLDERMLGRIKSALRKLAACLSSGKKLLGNLDGEWSYEVGDLRIIYELKNGQMNVLFLEHVKR